MALGGSFHRATACSSIGSSRRSTPVADVARRRSGWRLSQLGAAGGGPLRPRI